MTHHEHQVGQWSLVACGGGGNGSSVEVGSESEIGHVVHPEQCNTSDPDIKGRRTQTRVLKSLCSSCP